MHGFSTLTALLSLKCHHGLERRPHSREYQTERAHTRCHRLLRLQVLSQQMRKRQPCRSTPCP